MYSKELSAAMVAYLSKHENDVIKALEVLNNKKYIFNVQEIITFVQMTFPQPESLVDSFYVFYFVQGLYGKIDPIVFVKDNYFDAHTFRNRQFVAVCLGYLNIPERTRDKLYNTLYDLCKKPNTKGTRDLFKKVLSSCNLQEKKLIQLQRQTIFDLELF